MDWQKIFEINIYHGYILQILLAEILFTFSLKRRVHFAQRVIIGSVIYCILAIIVPNLIAQKVSGLFSLSIFLLSLGLCNFCFDCSFSDILFSCVGAQLTQNLSYNIENLIYQPMAEIIPHWGWGGISILTTAIVYASCYCLFAKRLKNIRIMRVNRAGVYMFSLTAALFVYVMQYLLQMYEIDTLWVTRPPLILCCIFGLCVQFEWIALAGRREENQFLERMIEKEKRQYELTKNSMDLINMKAHDLKHQITRIRRLGEVEDDELNEIQTIVEQYEINSITGNKIFDVILAEKQLICKENGIQMTVMADGDALRFLKPSDIAALFGNALDNAIECECKIEEEERRCITIDIHKKGNILSIRVENYCPVAPKFVDGFPITTKSDGTNHGFGFRSIWYIAKKYDGMVRTGVRDNFFILCMTFEIKN